MAGGCHRSVAGGRSAGVVRVTMSESNRRTVALGKVKRMAGCGWAALLMDMGSAHPVRRALPTTSFMVERQ
jgi:hypothetical protein